MLSLACVALLTCTCISCTRDSPAPTLLCSVQCAWSCETIWKPLITLSFPECSMSMLPKITIGRPTYRWLSSYISHVIWRLFFCSVESYMHVFGEEAALSEFNPTDSVHSRQYYLHMQEKHMLELFQSQTGLVSDCFISQCPEHSSHHSRSRGKHSSTTTTERADNHTQVNYQWSLFYIRLRRGVVHWNCRTANYVSRLKNAVISVPTDCML